MWKKALFLLLSCTLSICAYEWQPSAPLTEAKLKGAMYGSHDDVLIIAGGMQDDVYLDDIIVLKKDKSGQFRKYVDKQNKLPEKLAHGCSISTSYGMFCIGGRTKNYISHSVFLLKWDPVKERIDVSPFDSLPVPLTGAAGCVCDNRLYIVGGIERDQPVIANARLYEYDLRKFANNSWVAKGFVPMPFRNKPIVIGQSNGLRDNVYIVGGSDIHEGKPYRDIYSYDPTLDLWQPLDKVPEEYTIRNGTQGGSNMLLFQGDKIFAYHTVLDQWWTIDELPAPLNFQNIEKVGNDFILGPDDEVQRFWSSTLSNSRLFGWVNYTVLAIYFLIMLGVGFYFSRREKTTEDYFLAGHRIPWWAAGLSIFGTYLSTITYMSLPSKGFASDWQYAILELTLILVAPLIIYAFIPLYRKLNLTTAYQYLEKRFHVSISLLGSIMFISYQFIRIGIVLYLPSIALAIITGFTPQQCIFFVGCLTIIYTVLGGMEAVIWTDVIQVAILAFGALFTFFYLLFYHGDVSTNFLDSIRNENKATVVDFSFAFNRPTLWVVLFAGIAYDLMDFGTSQTTVQRYLTTKTEKDARKSLYINVVLTALSGFFFLALGTVLFAFYKVFPHKLDPSLPIVDGILVNFIAHELPTGISGLMVTGIFAASMSTLDSCMNSVSATITVDFFQRFNQTASEKISMLVARLTTLLIGVIGTMHALYLSKASIISLIDEYDILIAFTLTGVSGIFLLGVLSKRANTAGCWVGFLISFPLLCYVHRYSHLHFLLLMPLSTLFVMTFSFIASLFFVTDETPRYTIHDL